MLHQRKVTQGGTYMSSLHKSPERMVELFKPSVSFTQQIIQPQAHTTFQ